jgi:hypothetical protein
MRKLLIIFYFVPSFLFCQNIDDWYSFENNGDTVTKIALIIGNTNYEGDLKLKNPINDAELMNKTFNELNFDKIIFKKDLDYNNMRNDFLEYYDLQLNYGLSIIFFAGHGLQDENGNSYILPIDFTKDSDIKEDAISVRELVHLYSRNDNNRNLFILDACRQDYNSSFSQPNMKEPVNTKLAFSTSFGSLAFDNPELDNSLYSSTLANALKKTNLSIYQVLQSTWSQVYIKSKHKQSPAQHFGYILENYYLK